MSVPKVPQTGAYISPPDYRDLIASAAVAAAAPVIDLPPTFRTELGSVLDQNKIPACVSHSIVYLMRLYWFGQTGKWVDFSPRFLDTLVKRYDGLNREVDGTYPRKVLNLAAKYGCCTTLLLPNNTDGLSTLDYRNDKALTSAMFEEAEHYKIPGYVSVPDDLVSTRQAIYLYGALSSLFVIGDEFWTPSWFAKDLEPLRTPSNPVSGHQLAPIGWTSPTLNLLRNEWSKPWADDGEATYDANKWRNFIYEQWAITTIPKDVAAFLKVLPAATDFHYQWLHNLKRGDLNVDVKFLQVAYMILGFLKPIQPDEFGYFGGKTSAANLAFQTTHKIFPTAPNDVGNRTRAALNAIFSV